MTYQDFIDFIAKTYAVSPEFLWQKFPKFAVFRHAAPKSGKRSSTKSSTKKGKWFALLMPISADKLSAKHANSSTLPDAIVTVVNVKTDPRFIGNLLLADGVYPAYHMNKAHWVSVRLDEIDEALLFELVAHSFDLTAG
ncbi:hypothetical protein B0181_11200 [Moraxella caviae]|uniref:Uncharacterized protein conserved in bacteria n=1 Tax=Moraxella caviae TaxID=34060 RepID=A0A1S9ZU80_9GAMM|nr:MmcQ/YjbR family DNA-binding protein [Moraxella caviae]OOR87064.1 hypothetical protein B0181_11200 [Moraxella caviae]STZ13804.1 Uncharacterized protein conserved in bacteria [Moraxella caviae]VEW10178.1 Uncharacterized protein conserved in bacteria [Moraxella caviae]VEW10619.1 Uncharacterized protein conserved in bacteria [Moraxella caviae]